MLFVLSMIQDIGKCSKCIVNWQIVDLECRIRAHPKKLVHVEKRRKQLPIASNVCLIKLCTFAMKIAVR